MHKVNMAAAINNACDLLKSLKIVKMIKTGYETKKTGCKKYGLEIKNPANIYRPLVK